MSEHRSIAGRKGGEMKAAKFNRAGATKKAAAEAANNPDVIDEGDFLHALRG